MEPTTTIAAGFTDLDYAVLGILLLSGLFAMFRGFVRELFSLIAWTAAYFVAAKYHGLVEPWLHHHIHNEQAATLGASVGLFLIVLIALTVIGNAISDAIRGRGLTAIDRSLGFLFGLVRGALIACIIYLVFISIWFPDIDKPAEEQAKNNEKPPEWLVDAKTRPALTRGADMLKRFIPETDIKKTAGQFGEQKTDVQHMIDQETLDKLSTPAIETHKDIQNPSYDDTTRDKLNSLINEKSK